MNGLTSNILGLKLEIGCRRNAKLQLGSAFPDAKLELGAPKQA